MISEGLSRLPARLGDFGAISRPLRAWRELGWIILGESVGAVGALVGVRVLSGQLHPTIYGELSLALTAATLISQIVVGPLANASERFYTVGREQGQIKEFLQATRRLSFGGSLVVIAVGALIAAALVLLGQSQWLLLEVTAVVFAVGSGWEGVLDATQNAARRRRFVAWHRALRQWLRPILAISAVLLLGIASNAALLGFAAASLLVIASQVLLLKRHFRDLPDSPLDAGAVRTLGRHMLAFAAPISLWGAFTFCQVSSDRWALGVYGSTEQVGLYAVVLQLGSGPVHLLGGVLAQLAAPIVYARAGDAQDRVRLVSAIRINAAVAGVMLVMTCVLALGAVFAHNFIFGLLAGETYRAVSWLLPLAILSAGIFQVGQLVSLLLMTLGRSRALVLPKIATAVMAVTLNVVAAATYGMAGVLVAGLIFAIVYTLAMILVFVRCLPEAVRAANS